MKKRIIGIKKISCVVFVALLTIYGFCLANGRVKVSAEENGYTKVGSEPKLYDTIAGLTKGRFPSEYSDTGNDLRKSGIYTLDEHADDQYPVYFYKGNRRYVYNHVRFAGFCWMAVRTTTNGGVKLLYNGPLTDKGKCSDGLQQEHSRIGLSVYNDETSGLEKVGYMYGDGGSIPTVNIKSHVYRSHNGEVFGNSVEWDGTKYTLVDTVVPGYINGTTSTAAEVRVYATHHYTCASTSTTCETVYYLYNVGGNAKVLSNGLTHEDITGDIFSGYEHDSTVKAMVDNWYAENMLDYTSQLEDAIYCNDKTLLDGSLASNNAPLSYGPTTAYHDGPFVSKGRMNKAEYSVDCPNVRDSFTVSSENGNGQLTYPVGLLTMDEARLANLDSMTSGYISMSSGSSYVTTEFWSMSPYDVASGSFYGTVFLIARTGIGGDFNAGSYKTTASVRPVVTVNSDALVYCGKGTMEEPYALADEYCDHVYIQDSDMYKALRDCDLEKCPELRRDAHFGDDEQMIRLSSRENVFDLNLDNNNLKDVSDLAAFTKLQNLSLRNNHIEDIEPLLQFTEMRSTIELANNNILNTDLIEDICNARVEYFYTSRDSPEYVPELCADGSYEGALNLAFDWITNQSLEDTFDDDEYDLPSTMWVARLLSEMIFDYRPTGDEEECDPAIEWCYESEYNRQREIPAIMLSQYFEGGIKPEDLLYIENATLEKGDDGDKLHISDITKNAVLSYRIGWKMLFGDAWDEFEDEVKADIIRRNGGNEEYWDIATIILRTTHAPLPDSPTKEESLPEVKDRQISSESSVQEKVIEAVNSLLPKLPQTFDDIAIAVVGLAAALLGGFAIYKAFSKR